MSNKDILDYPEPFKLALQTFVHATPPPINDLLPLLPHTRREHKSRLDEALNQTKAILSQLDSFIETLNEVRRTYERRAVSLHNALYAPLLALPSEIVENIFERIMNATKPDYYIRQVVQQAYHLTHICSYWRTIGILQRRLWSRINLGMVVVPQTLDLWIERSASGSIDVWAYKEDEAEVVEELQPRIRYLHLLGIEHIEGGSFDRLDTLWVHGRLVGGFFRWNTPVLRQLGLAYYEGNLTVPESLRASVRTLCIRNPRPQSNWAHVLASFERLERFDLSHCPSTQDAVVMLEDGISLALGSLTHLHVEEVNSNLAVFLFSKSSNPNLNTLSIGAITGFDHTLSVLGSREEEVMEFLSQSPSLHSITLNMSHPWVWPSLLELLTCHLEDDDPQFLPRLQHLHLRGRDIRKTTASTLNIRPLIKTLHERNVQTSQRGSQTRVSIDGDQIWNVDRGWYQTMNSVVERRSIQEYGELWAPIS